MRRTHKALLALTAVTSIASMILSGCGSADSAPEAASSGETLTFLNYGDWIDLTDVAGFAKETGITVQQLALPSGGSSALAAQLQKDKGAYDMVFIGNYTAARLQPAGVLAEFDASQIPNLGNVVPEIVEQYPLGVPTDVGKLGIIYDKTKVSNPPTSWRDLFANSSEWSGKIIFPDYDVDVVAIALLAAGYDINTGDPDELSQAEDLVKEIKPDLLAFSGKDQVKSIVDGSAQIAVVYDYAFASQDNPNIAWISPSEGTPGYIEGVALVAGTEHADAALKFMNYLLRPEVHAAFINKTGASYIIPAAEQYLDESIRSNPALSPNPASPFLAEKFVSAEASELRTEIWNRIKAS